MTRTQCKSFTELSNQRKQMADSEMRNAIANAVRDKVVYILTQIEETESQIALWFLIDIFKKMDIKEIVHDTLKNNSALD